MLQKKCRLFSDHNNKEIVYTNIITSKELLKGSDKWEFINILLNKGEKIL